MDFDAAMLSVAWLSVAQAFSKDKERPALNRTVLVEQYPDGIQLVATDSFVLLRTWVPKLTADDDEPPPGVEHGSFPKPLDEQPERVLLAHDPDGRARQLMGYVRGRKPRDDEPPLAMRLDVDVEPDTLPGLAMQYLAFELLLSSDLDLERVRIPISEAEFPSWRKVVGASKAVRTDTVALAPGIIGRLAKLGALHDDAPLRWTFGGQAKPASISIGERPHVTGMVMPVAWDLDRNRPQPEPAADEPLPGEQVVVAGPWPGQDGKSAAAGDDEMSSDG